MIRTARWCASLLLALAAWVLPGVAGAEPTEGPALRAQHLAHLLGYLDADYGRFGAKEHSEHAALAATARRLAATLSSPPDAELHVTEVGALIDRAAPASEVHAHVVEASAALIGVYRIEQAPAALPSATRGRALYEQHCAACHGVTGHADTEVAAALRPHPASFYDPVFGETLSPYDVTTAIRFGVDGTAMAPLASLADSDRWDIAFYLLGLRHPGPLADDAPAMTVSELARRTDRELRDHLFAAGIGGAALDRTMNTLRRRAAFEGPPRGDPVALARGNLDEARVAFLRGDHAAALEAVRDASKAVGVVAAGGVDPALVVTLRRTLAQLGERVRYDASLVAVDAAMDAALDVLTHAEHTEEEARGQRARPSAAGGSALSVVRAALLALLAVAALSMARGLRAAPARRKAVYLGWLGAMGVGLAVVSVDPAERAAQASAWPEEAPVSASQVTRVGVDPLPPAQGACSEPGFGPGPELHPAAGLLAFDVTHDCMFPGRSRLEIGVNLRQTTRPVRAEVDTLLRNLFEQVRSATAASPPELTHLCAFAAGTVEWKAPYGCVEFEADEGAQGELAVRVDLPFEPAAWAQSFAASHAGGFTGAWKPQVTFDEAKQGIEVVYPYIEKGQDRWTQHLTYREAAIHLFPILFDFYPPQTEVQALRFQGVWRGRPVLTVHIADMKAFLAMDPWPIRERMAASQIPLAPGAARTREQDAVLGQEYLDALAKLAAGSVVVDEALLARPIP